MKYLSVLCLSLNLLPVLCGAQTKKIAYKSHSGNAELFARALENELFDMSFSNFGMAPTKIVKNAKLDSVIFISEHKAIMVTSEYCHDRYENTTTLWQAGKDTVTDHPLFSKQHDLDSIKRAVKRYYYFRNPVDSVKFIGYDNRKVSSPPSSSSSQQKQEIIIPVSGSDVPPPSNRLPLYIAILVVASLFSGLFSWQYTQAGLRA